MIFLLKIRRPAFREASPAYESEPVAPRRVQSQHDNNRPRNSQEHQQNQVYTYNLKFLCPSEIHVMGAFCAYRSANKSRWPRSCGNIAKRTRTAALRGASRMTMARTKRNLSESIALLGKQELIHSPLIPIFNDEFCV